MSDSVGWQETWTAVGTVGATVVALALGGWAEARSLRDRRRRADAAERAQAERITAWVGKSLEPTAEELDNDPKTAWPWAIVQNGSGEPVWDVTVHAYAIEGSEAGPDGAFRPVRTPWPERIPAIPPLGQQSRRVPSGPLYEDELPAPLAITFRDSGDRWWRRDETGRLHRLDAEPEPIPQHRWQERRPTS